MHGQVECDGNPGDRGPANELGEAEQCCGGMVVAVEESKRLLLDHQKDGVNELDVFGDVVELLAVSNPIAK